MEQYSERMAELVIRDITSWIVDAPTTRKHRLSNTEITHQSYVIVRVTLKNGLSGYGEAATLGGPRWAEESVESIKSAVDKYLAPSLGDLCAFHFEEAALRMAKAATRNFAAKAAIESALYDAVGKSLGLPSSALLGGAVRSSMEVIWALASGDADQEIAEAQTKLAAREHRHFKIKIGFKRAPDDMVRLRRIIDAIGAESTIIVDVNQAWSEATAIKHISELAEMGVALIEQPVAAGRLEAMARVRGAKPNSDHDRRGRLHLRTSGARRNRRCGIRPVAQAGQERWAHGVEAGCWRRCGLWHGALRWVSHRKRNRRRRPSRGFLHASDA